MNTIIRTNIYVDGFNLYYGVLRKNGYKWLNLKSLFSELLKPNHKIVKIKLFTAKVSSTSGDKRKSTRQTIYLEALKSYCEEVEVHLGHFSTHEVKRRLVDKPQEAVKVLNTEEKGSDVNLAVHLLNDAWKNEYDCAVIVSNDSDLATAMKLVKEQDNKSLGLFTPGSQSPSKMLKQYAKFHRKILANHLKSNQLPETIPDTNFRKPFEW